MAYLLNEQKMIQDNVFKYEGRINSELSRFLDKSPTFVTYYHINNHESTADGGFRDIEDIISHRSPLRFQKIENFPLYGIDQIIPNLTESEEGLNTDFSDDAVLLPNTIKPFPNDFFMLETSKGKFLFRVTEIQYDNIRPDNFYKITYRFEYLDDDKVEKIDEQVHDKFTCILENIGTENQCLIENEALTQLTLIDALYNDMVETYFSIFYNKRYNCFLGETGDGYKLFDPLQSVFFNKHKLLVKKSNYSTIVLSEGFEDNKRKIKYERSIYRFFERRDVSLINGFWYNKMPGIFKKDSSFSRWNDQSIIIMDNPQNAENYKDSIRLLPTELVNQIRLNGPTDSIYVELMQKFIRKEDISIYDIPLTLNEELLKLDGNEEVYFFTPLLMYIIYTIVNHYLKK